MRKAIAIGLSLCMVFSLFFGFSSSSTAAGVEIGTEVFQRI